MVEDILNKFGERIVEKLRSDIRNKPLRRRDGKAYVASASGKLERELNYRVDANSIKVYANDYIYFLEYGRRPTQATSGSGQVRKAIRQWIDDKGIVPRGISKDSLAYLIARSIHRNGTLLYPQGSDLISGCITDEMLSDFKNDLFLAVTDIVGQSLKTLKQAA